MTVQCMDHYCMPHRWPAIVVHMRLGQDLSPATARFDAEHLWCGIGFRACRRSESRFGLIHFVDRHVAGNWDARPNQQCIG